MSGASPDPTSSPSPGDDPGARPKSFRARFQTYVAARLELLDIESREAGRFVVRQGILAAALAVVALFAYALILVALVAVLGQWLSSTWPATFASGWPTAALTLGVLHVIVAGVLIALLRRKNPARLFDYTRSEFQKDREWLQHDPSSNENGS